METASLRKARVTRDSALNFTGAVLASGCSALRSFLLPKLLTTVDAFGVLSFLNLFRTYSPYVNLGVQMGYGIEVPIRRGGGDTGGLRQLEGTAYTFTFLTTLVFAALMILLAFGWAERLSAELQIGLIVFATVIVMQNVLAIYRSRLRIELNFLLKNQSDVVMAVLFTVIAVGLAAWWGVYAVYAGLLVGELAALAWVLARDPFRFPWGISRPTLAMLTGLGLQMTVCAVFNALIFDIDLILIKIFFPGFREMGLYGLGITFSAIVMVIPLTVGHALSIHIYHEAGRPEAERDLFRYLRKPVVILGLITLLMNGAGFLLFYPVIRLYLPKYIPGLPAMQVLLWYTTFLAIVNTTWFVFDGLKRFISLMKYQLLMIGLNIGINLWLFSRGWGILGVAWATLITYIVYCAFCLVYALRLCRQRWGTIARFIGLIFLACGYLATATLAIDRTFPYGSSAATIIGWNLVKLAAYVVAALPLAVGAELWMGVVSELRELLTGMIRRKLTVPGGGVRHR